ncbi:MAG: hemolysin III family protein [Anaerolineales bacterium]|nr:hemolysin III family protein [Anaerolineales bacterium]
MSTSPTTISKQYSPKEELANSITHGIGVVLSIVGLVVLVMQAVERGDAWHIVSYSIFGASLILLYLASTLYHSIPNPTWKKVLKRFDHSAIFLLIAGTYTPFLLVTLRGAWGWSLFGVIWALTITGLVLKIGFIARFEKLTLGLYILMGWLVVIAIKPMLSSLALGSLIALLVGGIAYTSGVVFYVWKKLPFNHAIWHGFVMIGSVAHFIAVFNILN